MPHDRQQCPNVLTTQVQRGLSLVSSVVSVSISGLWWCTSDVEDTAVGRTVEGVLEHLKEQEVQDAKDRCLDVMVVVNITITVTVCVTKLSWSVAFKVYVPS